MATTESKMATAWLLSNQHFLFVALWKIFFFLTTQQIFLALLDANKLIFEQY